MPEKPQLPKTGVKRTAAKKGPAISVAEFLALKNPKGNLLLSLAGETVLNIFRAHLLAGREIHEV